MKKRYPPVAYHNLWFRIFAAIGVSNFLMFYGDERTFWSSLTTWIYYESLIESFIIAFFLICFVHVITKTLDRYCDWQEHLFYRLVLQLAFGVCLPVIFAVCLAMVFCYVNHINIYKSDYFTLALPLIKIMILLLNIYYFLHYYYIQIKKGKIAFARTNTPIAEPESDGFMMKVRDNENGPSSNDELLYNKGADDPYIGFDIGDTYKRFKAKEDIACFIRLDNNYWMKTFDGKSYLLKDSLTRLEEKCVKFDFLCRINRSTIINYHAIAELTYDNQKRRHVITFKDSVTNLDGETIEKHLRISQDSADDYYDWLDTQN